METIFDWLTVLTFAALAVIYLQRSAQAAPKDKVWHYVPPAIGCAAVNYAGNEGYVIPAAMGLVMIMAYIYYVLKPQMSG